MLARQSTYYHWYKQIHLTCTRVFNSLEFALVTIRFRVLPCITGLQIRIRVFFLKVGSGSESIRPGSTILPLRLRKAQVHVSLEKPYTNLIALFSSNREHAKIYLILHICMFFYILKIALKFYIGLIWLPPDSIVRIWSN